jgi:hypothetical protein
VTTGAPSAELGVLKTESPVGRAAGGWPGVSPVQTGAGPGEAGAIRASTSGASASWRRRASSRRISSAR